MMSDHLQIPNSPDAEMVPQLPDAIMCGKCGTPMPCFSRDCAWGNDALGYKTWRIRSRFKCRTEGCNESATYRVGFREIGNYSFIKVSPAPAHAPE